MSLAGHATPAGTAAHAAAFAAGRSGAAYGALGTTGLTVSRLGFGGYRVDDETPEHRAALEQALLGGVNVIDTSTNYTDGASERLVGQVLRELVGRGALPRDALVVVSKIGYVQGSNLALAREREAAGRPFPEMVRYAHGCWHSIHPEFLADQLARSLGRLGLDTLDVCLLHNPEYFFADATHRTPDAPLPHLRAEFSRRLREAFGFFEARVAAGALRWYGVSSNTAAASPEAADATSLADMLEAARDAGGPAHHFGVLQVPLNLFEADAATARNQPGKRGAATVLEAAAEAGVGVLVNRPLNAIVAGRLVRLADAAAPGDAVPVDSALAAVAELEAGYRRDLAAAIRVTSESAPPVDFFRWGEQLADLAARGMTLEQWSEIEARAIRPTVAHVVRALDEGLPGSLAGAWRGWRDQYLPALARLLAAFRRRAATASRVQSQAVAEAIDPHLPSERRGESLARKALWVLGSTPGVAVVLVGMRRPAYVDDAVGILGWPPLAGVGPVYATVAPLANPAT